MNKEEFWIIISLLGLVGTLIIISFGYRFFADWRNRIVRLEKKNGQEQYQIDWLKKELAQTNQKLAEQKEINLQLLLKVQQLEKKLKTYESKQ